VDEALLVGMLDGLAGLDEEVEALLGIELVLVGIQSVGHGRSDGRNHTAVSCAKQGRKGSWGELVVSRFQL
jgi:hypothetical protein